MRGVQAAGWQGRGVGTGGKCLPARSGHPIVLWGVYPHCAPRKGLTPPFPQQVLPPQWQLWSCPCPQGHSHRCAQWLWTHRTPGGTDPPPSCLLPLLSKTNHCFPPRDPRSAPSLATPSVSPLVSAGVPAPQPVPRVTLSRLSPLCRGAPAAHTLQQMVEVTFVSE